MRVTHLRLRNYRVYEELDLDIPPGLVGIYGPNGGGKSTLVEAIRFSLYGRARTTKEEIRTSGVNDDCVAELEFEHEGHLYRIRRTISGLNHTVKASAYADGLQVAEGVRDTARYVHSILGMDDAAFRASVFAEQKQLTAFSLRKPEERRALVLQLLGITPVDAARDMARRDAREAQNSHKQLRAVLPDLDAARAMAAARAEARGATAAEAAVASQQEAEAKASASQAEKAFSSLDVVRQEHEKIVAAGRALAASVQAAEARAAKLAEELASLETAAADLVRLTPVAEGVEELQFRLAAVKAVVELRAAAAEIKVPPEPPPPDGPGLDAARAAAAEAAARLAEVEGRLGSARSTRDRAADAMSRSDRLTDEADCPLCGQALGRAFAQVQAHRAEEVAAARVEVESLEASHTSLAAAAAAAVAEVDRRSTALAAAAAARGAYEAAAARRAEADRRRAEAEADRSLDGIAVGGGEAAVAQLAALGEELARRRRAATEVQRLAGRLERRAAVESDLEAEHLAAAEGGGQVVALREKVAALGFRPADLDAAAALRDSLRAAAEAAARRAQEARIDAAQAAAAAEAAELRVTEAEAQHAALESVADDARHLGRLAELLGAFRNELVATVGPRLAAHAAELFAELTDREYDDLLVDADTYEIKVRDGGRDYGMDRFSGSEIDLANLALRVAISEQVRFQAGGTVGLLVLDEVFGPLDDERKARMLGALVSLGGRFRQVLVVTHDEAIKEQLPHALGVQKLPGRRARVDVVGA